MSDNNHPIDLEKNSNPAIADITSLSNQELVALHDELKTGEGSIDTQGNVEEIMVHRFRAMAEDPPQVSLKRTREGVNCSLYRSVPHMESADHQVADETWFTWDEFLEPYVDSETLRELNIADPSREVTLK
ncbi:hypothetical protein [Halosegnis longus]|uniref:hypothetical protein n=1 Tax=Halosegnis longus TaxID=2216012 RepID=UPI00129D9CE7|nr:hypothetical protein [Halosegnis longus]